MLNCLAYVALGVLFCFGFVIFSGIVQRQVRDLVGSIYESAKH